MNNAIQYQLDTIENPDCCTEPDPLSCAECFLLINPDNVEHFISSKDFCSEECLQQWKEKNWEE